MMKKAIKKLLAALLAVAMLCAMAVPAFAASSSNDGKITINNAVSGQTYTIYRILELEYDQTNNAYRYTAVAAWNAFINTRSSDLKVDNATGTVTWVNSDKNNNSSAIQNFADAAGKWASDNTIANDGSQKASGSTVTFTDLPLGWYLVVSSLSNGAICSIGTTDKEVTINEKNGAPTVDKEVLEDSTNTYGKGNDADVGDTVTFRATIKVTDGDPKNYVLHDKMSDGLTFKGITSVTRTNAGTSTSDTLNENTHYTLKQGAGVTVDPNCTFELAFKENVLKPNDVVVVEYTAVINEKAVIGSTGNPNEATLEYKDGTRGTSSSTKTYTWKIDIYKYFQDSTAVKKPLQGATFVLYRQNSSNIPEYAKISADKIEWVTEKEQATPLTSDKEGKIAISRLDADTYYLEETKAPTGYNPLTSPIEIKIEHSTMNETSASATITYKQQGTEDSATNITSTENRVEVENKTGTTLPSTGGMGTTLFYVVGGGLMVAAIVLLVTKKRMENK
ncbi:SpaH/EbpB family LPXTG-anchored major pilin [Faecalibacterium sp. AM43-5AT]|jgi:fimbrial isopeptide formation D2 family protein/LPXTG-motif cell wall-anchored protein|uniref:SpaH/EbpB family LPXTG-anchored major pilin n=1 Tax=Faecalibacterium sp. AM43-5AT TaxID=2302957 RepID=UPI000E754693|nr:SpaH/EbpB family LPXTG-anchored major pilin [Faecalibacterium sp. AM43-5AT]RJV94592.1 isopeptide-forming domain-containing fimbrial protein [Faecalibacterium sp. AM43-5AT]